MIAPTGASKLFHGAGEPAVARAAGKFGMVYSLSTLSTATIEEVAAATPGPKAFQLYVFKDRGLTDEWLDRCIEAGYVALQLTVDTPVAGNRERDFVYGFGAAPRSRLRQVASFARYPGWLYRALLRNDLEMVNITSTSEAARNWKGGIRKYIDEQLERSLTWKDVEWLAGRWPGALVIKGVQTVEDCRKAAESGATAVMLSNHGGRQLESAPAPVDCIAAVADALHDRLAALGGELLLEVLHDLPQRPQRPELVGLDRVVKALALGAHACSIGRGYLFALAAGGQVGVERALTLLRTEVERTMALVGCDSVRKLGRSHVRHRG